MNIRQSDSIRFFSSAWLPTFHDAPSRCSTADYPSRAAARQAADPRDYSVRAHVTLATARPTVSQFLRPSVRTDRPTTQCPSSRSTTHPCLLHGNAPRATTPFIPYQATSQAHPRLHTCNTRHATTHATLRPHRPSDNAMLDHPTPSAPGDDATHAVAAPISRLHEAGQPKPYRPTTLSRSSRQTSRACAIRTLPDRPTSQRSPDRRLPVPPTSQFLPDRALSALATTHAEPSHGIAGHSTTRPMPLRTYRLTRSPHRTRRLVTPQHDRPARATCRNTPWHGWPSDYTSLVELCHPVRLDRTSLPVPSHATTHFTARPFNAPRLPDPARIIPTDYPCRCPAARDLAALPTTCRTALCGDS
jgi:hypothetical protein